MIGVWLVVDYIVVFFCSGDEIEVWGFFGRLVYGFVSFNLLCSFVGFFVSDVVVNGWCCFGWVSVGFICWGVCVWRCDFCLVWGVWRLLGCVWGLLLLVCRRWFCVFFVMCCVGFGFLWRMDWFGFWSILCCIWWSWRWGSWLVVWWLGRYIVEYGWFLLLLFFMLVLILVVWVFGGWVVIIIGLVLVFWEWCWLICVGWIKRCVWGCFWGCWICIILVWLWWICWLWLVSVGRWWSCGSVVCLFCLCWFEFCVY